MKHTHHRRSDCPNNFALEMFCDTISAVLRDEFYAAYAPGDGSALFSPIAY